MKEYGMKINVEKTKLNNIGSITMRKRVMVRTVKILGI